MTNKMFKLNECYIKAAVKNDLDMDFSVYRDSIMHEINFSYSLEELREKLSTCLQTVEELSKFMKDE